MKRKIMTSLFTVILILSMIASMSVMAVRAQEIPEELSEVGGSAFSDTKTTYIVTLYWDDNDNAYGTRPEEVVARITANDGEFGSDYLYLNEENGWENVKSQLPLYYNKGSRTGIISYEYEILDLPEDYSISINQEGNWFKVTCSLNRTSICGDVDNDNDVNAVDATLIQRYDVNYRVAVFNTDKADVNNDQNIDIIDSSIIQRYIIGYDCSIFEVGKSINK